MEQENTQDIPEDLAAFRLIQHFALKGEGTYDDFMNRVQALKRIATRLNDANKMEIQLQEQSEHVARLEQQLSAYGSLASPEVIDDMHVGPNTEL